MMTINLPVLTPYRVIVAPAGEVVAPFAHIDHDARVVFVTDDVAADPAYLAIMLDVIRRVVSRRIAQRPVRRAEINAAAKGLARVLLARKRPSAADKAIAANMAKLSPKPKPTRRRRAA